MTISVTDTLEMEKQAIGRCARRNPARSWLAWISCVLFLTSFTGFYVIWYTSTFDDYVESQIELRNGTRAFDWWQQPPFSSMFKIHVFNYTNVDDYEAGRASKLHVEDLGPYVYAETLRRVNVVMHDNGTVTFQQKRSFEWVGGRPESETVTVPNVPLMFTTAYVRDLGFTMRFITNTLLSTLQERPFISETVSGFLWGYDTKLFEMARPLMMFQRDIPFDKFGLMANKNGLDKDRFTIHTGSRGLDKLGMIDRMNGIDSRNVWGDRRCDKIEGTDGSMFPPHLIKNTSKPLYVYSKELCSTLPFHYAEQVTTFDIPSLRYKIALDAFNCSAQHDCFCQKVHGNSRICPPAGLFNISACNYDSPLLMSFPHFYGGDESLLEQVDGLNPQQKIHESYIDLHPRLATPIAGWSRMQANLEVRKATAVPFLGRLKDGAILPLVWVEAGVDELPEQVLEVLQAAHFTAAAVEIGLQWGTLIIMILSLSALLACFWKYRAERDADVLHKSVSSVQNNLKALS